MYKRIYDEVRSGYYIPGDHGMEQHEILRPDDTDKEKAWDDISPYGTACMYYTDAPGALIRGT